jgi:hypothetical protein
MTQDERTIAKKRSFNFKSFMSGVGIFLLETLIPAPLVGGILFLVSGTINFWQMERNLSIAIFAILFILLSLIVTIILCDIVDRIRKRYSPRLRLMIMILGGLIIPVGLFTGANLLMSTPGESYMTHLIGLSINQTIDVSMVQLGSTVINSNSPFTKVQGIDTISTIHSSSGMEQLFLILNSNPTSLANWTVADTLSKAIALYGLDAKPGLITAFQAHAKSPQTISNPTDLYDRYFSQPISSLQAEINAQPVDDQTKKDELKKFSEITTQLQSGLNDIQSESLQPTISDPVLDFVINTFLIMNITQDIDIYSLARTTASDTSFPASVRGESLLLIGKLGGKEDMSLLYQYLQNSDELIKANALQAIATLTIKLNGPAKTQ